MDQLSGDLSLRQLEYLVAVVDLGSLRAAAELLSVTQPTISHQLALLERRVGVALLEREGRGVRPTEAGRALAGTGRDVLARGRAGLERARRTDGTEELTIAVVSSLASSILPPALAAWRAEAPEVEVRIREFLRRDELVDAVRRGSDDPSLLAVAAPPPGWKGDVVDLGHERYVLVLPPGLERRPPVDLASLADVPWVLFDTDHGLSSLVARVCAEAGFTPRPAVRTSQIDTAVRLAAAGLGPTMVPAVSVPEQHAGLAVSFRPGLGQPVAAFGPAVGRPVAQRLLAHLTPERTGLDPP